MRRSSRRFHGLKTDRRALVARIGGPEPLPGLRVDADGVHQTDMPAPLRRVTKCIQPSFQARGKLIL